MGKNSWFNYININISKAIFMACNLLLIVVGSLLLFLKVSFWYWEQFSDIQREIDCIYLMMVHLLTPTFFIKMYLMRNSFSLILIQLVSISPNQCTVIVSPPPLHKYIQEVMKTRTVGGILILTNYLIIMEKKLLLKSVNFLKTTGTLFFMTITEQSWYSITNISREKQNGSYMCL